jgi:insulysin
VTYLKKATKQDVLDLLMTYLHPSSANRAKLSTHMISQYKGIKFDMSSAQPLIEAFTKHAVVIDQAALQKLMATQPDLQSVKDFALAGIKSAEHLSEDAQKELQSVVDALKGIEGGKKDDEAVKLSEGNVFIEDIHAFKAGLISSKAAMPLEPFGQVAKL